MKVVGTSGGAVTSSDGNLAVNIPAGALPSNVTITTEPAEAPATGAVGTVYEIGPTGTQFAMPVTLTLHYDAAALSGASESSLRVATYAAGAWQLLPGAMIDTQAKTVSGVTTHLSPYAIVTEAVGKTSPRCSRVGVVRRGAPTLAHRSAPGPSGGMSAGGTSTGDPAPGSGGTSMTCDPPTCAGATNVCGQYPGATMDSCTDSPKGYSAACCFPSNAPICFAIGGAGAACAGSTGAGAGGSTCPPPPTCASATAATACAGYPGATLQNCTDATNGFTGACCFAPEARVCVKAGAGRACAGSSAGGSAGGCSTPPPRCADGNPCAGFVGATADSCTDTTDGFEATCCFAAGTLPIATGCGSSAGGSADGGAPGLRRGHRRRRTGRRHRRAGRWRAASLRGGRLVHAGLQVRSGFVDELHGLHVRGGRPPDLRSVRQRHGRDGRRHGRRRRVDGHHDVRAGRAVHGRAPSAVADVAGACMDCMCGANGTFTCAPVRRRHGRDGRRTTAPVGRRVPRRARPRAPCTAGSKCGGDVAGACMDCMCGADGHLTCGRAAAGRRNGAARRRRWVDGGHHDVRAGRGVHGAGVSAVATWRARASTACGPRAAR